MPPVIILDSDDDEDDIGYSPPRNVQTSHLPVPVEAEAEGTSDSFGRVSRATTSTDPSFFQNVYNEQNDAARGYVPDPTEGSHDQHQHSSSDMTAPTPFKRTVTGLLDTSSSSTRDQSNAGGQRMSAGNGPDEWTQASTPGRRKAPTAVMDDMWDVPSSPDERPVKPKIKIKLKRSGAQSDSTTDSQRAKESGRMAKTPDSKSEWLGGSPSSKRKRRKVDHPEPSFQGSNEVDLVTIPFSHHHEGEHHGQSPPTPSMLPPTMPVNEDISFFIAPNPLTEAQRMEYESMQLPSSDSQPHQLPPVRQFNIQNIASSSEATNVNTPRSNATYLMSTAPPPPASIDPPQAAIGQATGYRWDSSPDVIAAIDSPPSKKAARLQAQSTKDDAPEPIDNEFVELQQTEPEQTGLPIIRETTPDSYEPEKMAKPTKAKKSRGRPKKKAAAEQNAPLTDSLPAPPEVVESVANPKKKRGRPRQSDAKEESPRLDQSLSTNDASLSEDAVQPEKRAKIEIEETETKDDLAEEDEAQVSSKNKGSETPALKEPDSGLSTRSISSIDDDTASKNPDTSRTTKQEEKPEKPTISSKGLIPSKGLSSIINKPMYRVGLSKKSRIAPLLKCLRKE
ncbi:hypothetical protein FLAG1_02309 [Fusarium langsethiae]|uniref:Uncharacterized protein n=1 Tax=Fusarium langsethiae TaxID=179993 RepID=A0A0N0DGX0_FUSLA|nr:hypothetical protein FLAG1_02309 [Fusarium langsethiae]GKU00648.1 unnamed protein product [Fusarium langsethiae]GKU14836.1 unnamed protein product [Fusarium langsethiae]